MINVTHLIKIFVLLILTYKKSINYIKTTYFHKNIEYELNYLIRLTKLDPFTLPN